MRDNKDDKINRNLLQLLDKGGILHQHCTSVRLKGRTRVNITCEDVVKLLGVDIGCDLSFDHHISNICNMAGKRFNVMRRIDKTYVPWRLGPPS